MRRFLVVLQDLHLIQDVHGPTRGNALLALVLAMGDDLVRGLLVPDHVGNSDHHLLDFIIQRRVSRAHTKTKALDFRKANFNEFRN